MTPVTDSTPVIVITTPVTVNITPVLLPHRPLFENDVRHLFGFVYMTC